VHELIGTARDHDDATGCGSLLLDDGTVLRYDAAAFAAGGLRLLRSGQRVRIRIEGTDPTAGRVLVVTLATFDLPDLP
jgi:2-phospho-L-lactate guanylyltransferase